MSPMFRQNLHHACLHDCILSLCLSHANDKPRQAEHCRHRQLDGLLHAVRHRCRRHYVSYSTTRTARPGARTWSSASGEPLTLRQKVIPPPKPPIFYWNTTADLLDGGGDGSDEAGGGSISACRPLECCAHMKVSASVSVYVYLGQLLLPAWNEHRHAAHVVRH